MPFDFKRRSGAQMSARRLAQVKIAMRSGKVRPAEVDSVLNVMLPYMSEDTTPEEVVDLATTAAKLHDQLKIALPLAEALKIALEEAAAEETSDDTEEDPAEVLARLKGAIGAAMIGTQYRGDPLARPGSPAFRASGHGRPQHPQLSAQLSDALYARITGQAPRVGAQYAGASLPELAEICLRAAGKSGGSGGWMGGRAAQAVTMALHSTSDFPLVLGNTVNRLMVEMYQAAMSGLKQVSRERLAADFRPVQGLRASGSLEFSKVSEGGEFSYGTVQEAGETVSAATFGRVLGVSRQAIVNDDLGLFESIARMLGEGAAQCEGKAFVGLLNSNSGAGPTMSDGQPLFHSTHGNVAGSGAALGVLTLSAARTAMRRQTDLAGSPINVTPTYLIVPPELETVAEQVLAEITAMDVAEVNPFSGKLTLVVDPYLTSQTRWYVASPPGRPEGLVHVYLDGAPGPQVFTQEGFEVDGMKFKGRLDFGCAFMDWRGWYMNPGA